MVDLIAVVITIVGLIVFEIVTSIDNAVINAEVLGTVSERMRRWFLTWGMLFAVGLMRGLLPLILVMGTHPDLGIIEALTFGLEGNAEEIQQSVGVLLMGGGVFLVFIFLHWLFMEPKVYGLHGERFFHKHSVWFYATVSTFLFILVWAAITADPWLALGAVAGSTIFFIVNGFRLNAEKMEREMIHKRGLSDWSKVMYLEAIDASFSIDGVVGAFAFTVVVPLIIIGNGIGAIAVRQLTVHNIERIKRYKYIKHGAMYSIAALGFVMIAEAFGMHIPQGLAPVLTFIFLGYFFWKSRKEMDIPTKSGMTGSKK